MSKTAALAAWGLIVFASPAYADDPVVNYVRVSVDSDRQFNCNDLNVEIANVSRDIGLLQSQDEELQGVVAQGPSNMGPQSSNLGNVFAALSNTLGTAAVVDAETSIPAVEASLSTARARVGYLESLQGSCANNNGQPQQQVQQTVPPAQPPGDIKTIHIRNVWKGDQYLNIEHGSIVSGQIQPDWSSARWQVQAVDGTPYVRLCNDWKPDQCLNVEHGALQAGVIKVNWLSAMWLLEAIPDTGFVRIQNRWRPDQYLNIEKGRVRASQIRTSWSSAKWIAE
jgi:hypothetical protein